MVTKLFIHETVYYFKSMQTYFKQRNTHTHTSSSPEMKAQYAGEISQFVSECERKGLNHLKYCLEAVRNC